MVEDGRRSDARAEDAGGRCSAGVEDAKVPKRVQKNTIESERRVLGSSRLLTLIQCTKSAKKYNRIREKSTRVF